MKSFLLILTAVFLMAVPAFAGQVAHIKVNGLVCDFCAQALEKVFGRQEAVEDITVDLNAKLITVTFKDGQSLDDAAMTKLVTDSGYTVENIHRMDMPEDDGHEE